MFCHGGTLADFPVFTVDAGVQSVRIIACAGLLDVLVCSCLTKEVGL